MSGRQTATERPAIPGLSIPGPGIPARAGRPATAAGAGAADLAGREVVIAPGACTGWHFHRVPLIALVKSGTLTRILHDNTTVVHPVGTSFIEPAGPEHLHLGRNLGTEPVVLYVTSTLAEGEPFSIPADAPPAATPCACAGHAW
ncbi:cupin domain-containing protein [Streptomyces sp. BR123]|uniref:cupin domain-containing protein n=1 Tax=Streptomyces sp. BR123 TaxID=2749828 RepID=UPI0015C4893F|nr:cupin domain-containing protein [Streptomyces sp. BR123]NXY93183.1 cupin domain-containing protein [Streptomyces sp. BR123]